MGYPTIVFNQTGSTLTNASGAGPATAVTGTAARSRASSARVGFFDGSPPDLSLVAVDGTHALALGTGAGRKITKITAKKETVQNTTGTATAPSAVITSMGSTTGMTAGDVIRAAGAGAAGADLYSTIASVDSATQVTLNDNASTNTGGAAFDDPKQVTTQHTFSISSDTAWAIGGKLDDAVVNDSQVPTDILLPGWTVVFEFGTGAVYNFSSVWTLSTAGDSTDGPITIKGTGDAYPRLQATPDSNPIFRLRAKGYRFEFLANDNAAQLVEVDSSAAGNAVLKRCSFSDGSHLIKFTSAATGSGFDLQGCEGPVQVEGAIKGLALRGSFCDLAFSANCGAQYILVEDSVATGTGTKISVAAVPAASPLYLTVNRCTFWTMTSALTVADLNGCHGLVFINNQLVGASGTALDLPTGANFVVAQVDHNNFWSNSTNRSAGIAAGANDTALDPEFRAAVGGQLMDLRTGLNAAGRGWPQTFPTFTAIAGNPIVREMLTSVDIGAAQRREPVGGTVLVRIISIEDTGTEYVVAYDVVNGAAATAMQATLVAKSLVTTETTPHGTAIANAIAAYLRDGVAADLVGREILA